MLHSYLLTARQTRMCVYDVHFTFSSMLMHILRMMMYMLLPCSLTHPYCARRFSMLQYWCIYQESKIHTSTCKRADKVGCAIAEFKQDEATRVRCSIRGDGRTAAQGEPALCMSEIANGDALLSVSFAYAGKSTQPEGEAKVALSPNGLRFPG